MNQTMPHIAQELLRDLRAPREHVSVMMGQDRKGDVLTVFVSKEWLTRLGHVPSEFHGVRVKVAKRGVLFT